MKKQNVVKRRLGLRFEQANILYHFLSADSDQPPTIIVTVKGAAASRVFFHFKAEAVRMGE